MAAHLIGCILAQQVQVATMHIPEDLEQYRPATSEQVATLEGMLGRPIPDALSTFYRRSNGLDSWNTGVTLFAVEEVYERNETFQVARYTPDFLAIGCEGALWLLLSFSTGMLYWVDAGWMQPEASGRIPLDLAEWISAGMPLPKEPDPNTNYVDVLLVSEPSKGLATLLSIRREFLPQMSPTELLELWARRKPVLLAKNVPLGPARASCAQINRVDDCLRLETKSLDPLQLKKDHP